LNQAENCGLRYTAADGWRLLLNPISIPAGGRAVLNLLWLVALAAPAGLLAPRRSAARARNAAVIAAGVGAAVVATGTIVLTVPEGLALAAGYVVGITAREAWRRWRRGARGGVRRAAPIAAG
jgi:hypothetical protein